MLLALEEAKLAYAQDEVPVGAVLVRNGKVLCASHNLCEQRGDACAHAELLCIHEGEKLCASKFLTDCTLYVTLEPCAMCAGAMVNARLGRLFFGAFDKRCGCCGSVFDLVSDTFYHTVLSVGGMAEKECAALLQSYFAKKR